MRVNVLVAVLVLFMGLAHASHACWEVKGSFASDGRDFFLDNGAVYAALASSSGYGIVNKYVDGSGWTTLASISSFNPHAIGVFARAVYVGGNTTSFCSLPSCAVIKVVPLDGGAPETSFFDVLGFSDASVGLTKFKQFIPTSSNYFIVADRGVVFQHGAPDCSGIEWCGRRVVNGSEFTAYSADGDGVLLGTDSGGVFRLTAGYNIAQLSNLPVSTQVSAIRRDANGDIYAISGQGVFYSRNNGASWSEIGYKILAPSTYLDIVTVTNADKTATALYVEGGGKTQAFMNTSQASTVEVDTGFPNPGGTVRFAKDASGNIWALLLSTATLYKFKCGASPLVPVISPSEASQSISFGAGFSIHPLPASGNGAGNADVWNWTLTGPIGLSQASLFSSYSYSGPSITGANATLAGSYTWRVNHSYAGFPTLPITADALLTIAPAAGAPATSPSSGAGSSGPSTNASSSSGSVNASPLAPPSSAASGSGSCTASEQCLSGSACVNSSCVELQCPAGQTAAFHACFPTCGQNSNCASNETCAHGLCQFVTCPNPRQIVLDHTCTSPVEITQCNGTQHNEKTGVCCSGAWMAGQLKCPPINATGSASGTKQAGWLNPLQPPFPQGYLPIAIIVVMAIAGVGFAVFVFITRQK